MGGSKLLGFSIIFGGIALGWCTGILLSPQSGFNDETTKFSKVQQLIVTFITGALAVKLLPIITEDNIKDLFKEHLILSRILYFLASFLLAAIIVYYDRVYMEDQDIAKLSFRRSDMLPNSHTRIHITDINDSLFMNFHNKGVSKLEILRESESHHNKERVIVEAGKCISIPVTHLGIGGDYIVVFNQDANNFGKFKLRIS